MQICFVDVDAKGSWASNANLWKLNTVQEAQPKGKVRGRPD